MAERKFRKVEDAEFIILGKTPVDPAKEDGPKVNSVEGTLQSKANMNMRGGLVGRYQFEKDDGSKFTLLGAKLLDEKLESISVGEYLRITLGESTQRTSSGNDMKTFEVEIAE